MRDAFEVDPAKLDAWAEQGASIYRVAKPFPHIVIDDFADPDLLNAVLEEVSDSRHSAFEKMSDRFQRKSSCGRTRNLGPKTRQLLNFLNGQELIEFLEKLTGIEGLIGDWQLAGGGIHALHDGGFLNVHADFNVQGHLKLDRRINLLLYLNKDWKEEYGGGLELWDSGMRACQQRIVPLFNRCVIFNTTDFSYHGNPEPVAHPEGRSRLSLAMYYYTNGRPAEETSGKHMTLFQYRPGEATRKDKIRAAVKRFVPPIVTDLLDARRN